jgi:thioredoxin 2
MSDRMVVCSSCGGINRLPEKRDASAAKCGKCSERLFGGHPHDVDAATFDRHVKRSTLPVLVDIWAPWCGPCLSMAPAYKAAAAELEPDVMLLKLDSDKNPASSERLGIRGIPTMILFHAGREVARTSGAMSASQIVSWVRGKLPATA